MKFKHKKKKDHCCKKPKVLFITKSRCDSYGIPIGLVNSANFISNALRQAGYDSHSAKVVDANEIDRVVSRYNPDIVVIGALFVTPEKFRELAGLHRHINRKWIVRIHSKAPLLAHESIAFDWLNEYKTIKNLTISCNNEDFNCDLVDIGYKSLYLPNIYAPVCDDPHHLDGKKNDEFLDIGCFGSIRSLKNQCEQAISAIIFANSTGKRLRFHINSSRIESQSEPEFKNLVELFRNQKNAELVQWNWLTHQEFLHLMKHMDILMQVSMSESFNIVVCDAICQNVPVVGSQDITWLPDHYKAIPTDTNDIIRKLSSVYKHPALNKTMCKRALDGYNKRALDIWENYLKV